MSVLLTGNEGYKIKSKLMFADQSSSRDSTLDLSGALLFILKPTQKTGSPWPELK